MRGHIRQRGKQSFELKFDAGRDPSTGKRKIQYASFKGTKRQAQIKLAELITAVDQSKYVEPSKATAAEFVRARVDQWEAAGDIEALGPRYRILCDQRSIDRAKLFFVTTVFRPSFPDLAGVLCLPLGGCVACMGSSLREHWRARHPAVRGSQ